MKADAFVEHRNAFFASWPFGKRIDEALTSKDNSTPLFYFADAQDFDLERCTWVLGRLGTELEKRFGISSEVLMLFTPYKDVQRRTYNALTNRLRKEVSQQQLNNHGTVRFTPDPTLALLYAPDPRLVDKVDAWNSEESSSLVAAIAPSNENSEGLRTSIISSLFAVLSDRDLYQGRNPVTGNDFFGREDTLRALLSSFRDGHSIGLFGLRRSGKTSVIREFQRRYRNQKFAMIISDLEATTSVELMDELPAQISADINSTLHSLKSTDNSVWIGPPDEHHAETFSQLGTRIKRIAEKNSRYTFVLAFDEVESLVPLLKIDPMAVRAFLGAIRRAAQSSKNVSLLLTGVTSRFFLTVCWTPSWA